MRTLVVYNTCGFGGTENSDIYIHNLERLYKQNCDKTVLFSGVGSNPHTIGRIKQRFGTSIDYYFTNDRLAVNQSFNSAVLAAIERNGPYDGYLYVASDITFPDNPNALERLTSRLNNTEVGMVSPEIDVDNGYYWWFDFKEGMNIWDVFGRDQDFVVPLGATANMHCMLFSHKLLEFYERVLPDIFVSFCTESIFSFVVAAIRQRFVIANDVTCQHKYDRHESVPVDGQTLAYGPAWDRLFPGSPRSIKDIVNDPRAKEVGLGYEEWVPRFLHKMDVPKDKPYLIHDASKFENGFAKNNDLFEYIKDNFYLKNDVLDYNTIKYTYEQS